VGRGEEKVSVAIGEGGPSVETCCAYGTRRIMIDGGATNHAFKSRDLIMCWTKRKRLLMGINGQCRVDVVHPKTMTFFSAGRRKRVSATLMGALYSAKLSQDILAESRLEAVGWTIHKETGDRWMSHSSAPAVKIPIVEIGGLYYVEVEFSHGDDEMGIADVVCVGADELSEHGGSPGCPGGSPDLREITLLSRCSIF